MLLKKSDLVICSSKELYREKIKLNVNTFFIPNAADISHSSKALDHNLPVSELMLQYKKPVIGYFGNIEGRIDFDLVKEAAEKNPDKSFVFIGPVVHGYVPEWFYNAPNIFLPGAVPYEQMPSVLKGFDVAIIPFRKNDFSKTIFPLKLFEYLGAGKPVVATDFNEDLFEFTKDTVVYCAHAESFSKSINDALHDSEVKLKARIAIAAENTWEQRALDISVLIADQLEKKKHG
jgi:glycosyltransferase involved in cell wall biosynthesis